MVSPTTEIGDTVIVETGVASKLLLEPAEVVRIGVEGNEVTIQELLCHSRDFNSPTARPNELVYPDRLQNIS